MPTSSRHRRGRLLIGAALLALSVVSLCNGWACRGEILAIKAYQRVGSPVMRHVVVCRFNPSCSHYAVRSLERNGFWKGNALIAKRLVLCSPLGYLLD
jgi:putative membrane protein insertion efficiency factor